MGYRSLGVNGGVAQAYGYLPNLPANITACVLFAIVLTVQLCLGAKTRDWWMFITWGITAGLEVAGYAARALAHKYTQSMHLYEMQETCLVFAPAFMAAGIYYQLAKVITVYGKKYSPLRPMTYTAICTTCDVLSLLIQGGGGGVAASGINSNRVSLGGWIMLAGIAFQLVSLIGFIGFLAFVTWGIFQDSKENWAPEFESNRSRRLFRFWMPALYISVLFLLIRSIYRVVELSDGWDGPIARTERYFLVMDGLMILLSMVPLCIVYPAVAYGEVPVEGVHYKKGRVPRFTRENESEKEESIYPIVNCDSNNGGSDAFLPTPAERAFPLSDTTRMIDNGHA